MRKWAPSLAAHFFILLDSSVGLGYTILDWDVDADPMRRILAVYGLKSFVRKGPESIFLIPKRNKNKKRRSLHIQSATGRVYGRAGSLCVRALSTVAILARFER